jgi:beta-phosphoglucomutase-like phosphatase (HAD superfamily)
MTDARRTLALDVDGVLLDWSAGFDAWLRDHGIFPAFPLTETRHFDLRDALGHLPYEDRLALIRRFNTDEAMGRLPVMAGAEEAVRRLRAHGLRLVAVTAPGDDPTTVSLRRAQLERFALDDAEILGLHADKTRALLRHDARALVDDSPKKIAEAEAALGTAFAYTWPYNADHPIPPSRRLFAWETCLPKILDHFR